MSEKALANKLRIALLDQIATVDLPGFLFEHLDQHLVELNYFKLSNLYNNVGRFTTYLKQVAKDYIVYVKKHNPQFPKSSGCLLYTSPSPRDRTRSRMPSSA